MTADATHWSTHRTDTFNATLERLLGNDGWFDEPVGVEIIRVSIMSLVMIAR